MKKLIIFLALCGIACSLTGIYLVSGLRTVRPKADRLESEMIWPSNELTKENVYAEIMRCDIKFSDIVLRQALLETGHFTSKNCLERNNLFGMKGGDKTNENPSGYRIFLHWRHSIQNYKEWQAKRISDDCSDCYEFLKRFGYSENPEHYDSLLRGIDVKINI